MPYFRLSQLRVSTLPSRWLFPICEMRLTSDSSSVVVTSEFWPDFESPGLQQGLQLLVALKKIWLAGFLKQPEFVIPIQMLNNARL